MLLTDLSKEELLPLLEKATAKIEELELLTDYQKDQIEALELQLEVNKTKKAQEKKTPVIPAEPVTVDGKLYKFKFARFRFDGELQLAEEAFHKTDLLQAILKIPGQGILQQVF